jgi:DNA-binding transcriptional LysR family regulator
MLQQMKYFIAVVDQHNFTRAAEECNISQSAISQQIKELENTVGVELLQRKGRSFELTAAGEYFYQHAQKIVAEVDKLLADTKQVAAQQEDEYVLRLGYLINFGSKEFLQAVAHFSKKYPNVKVKINSGMHEDLFDLLRNDKIDLNFSDQRRALSTGYNNEFLTETDFMAVIPKNFTADDKVTTDDLADLPCVIVAGSTQEAIEEAYYRDILGVKSQFLTARTGDEAQLMVASNQGYLIANSRTISLINQDVTKVVPLYNGGVPLHQKYYAYWKKNNSGYYIEEFADVLKEQF